MKENERYQSLRELIRPYLPEDVSPEDLRPDSHLIRDLHINSSHLVDLVLDLEDHFDIRLEDSEMQQMQTVEDALRIIEAKIKEN